MKKVYFVRHGETEGNVGDIQQTPKTPLNDQGLKQADAIAKRLSKISFDRLISSSYVRAIQTAERISALTNKDFIQSDLFVERIRPSEQVGNKKALNKESEKLFLDAWIRGEKYKDGESFHEITERARQALYYLDSLPEERIVVVSHGMFLRVIVAVILLDPFITPQICDRFMGLLKNQNTGITEIVKDKSGQWRLETWNDHAHLG